MQNQAKYSLQAWKDQNRLEFNGLDALSALLAMPSNSVDVIASAYTLHNFECSYREAVINEIFRVLIPGGLFVNGDRYALDGISQHTRIIQEEVSGYLKVMTGINRLDLLEHWIVHLFSDESENHVMRETTALKQLQNAGFTGVNLSHRMEVNALITAVKPQG
jgi:ubiquinone/menaquinone biosynthesis C-methylase UbiE